ncbi:SusD/RagB family nutrient-binding outer membrane lipoprotein [Ulvibacterium marinum]|uniref:SusD/RagB family nutrient-binding outer membrane lipoprotein n=1 Tax=Ulvibacterium marinum TaxID=2419782 RepID=UPI0024942930|nr:SusD/RagB family nutrient-binding outer membrane lipoprotein [Ulvibacterium marinum]
MKYLKQIVLGAMAAVMVLSSCEDITDINENPNGVGLNEGDPNFLVTNVMVSLLRNTTEDGYSQYLGAWIQHTQKQGWGDHKYEWDGSGGIDWPDFYDNLRTLQLAEDLATEQSNNFLVGVVKVLQAYNYGLLVDYYGDVPFSQSLNPIEYPTPVYDSSEDIYKGIIEMFQEAAAIFGTNPPAGVGVTSDIFFNGDVERWEKFANAMTLRYYMRLSEKDPSFAQSGVEATLSKPMFESVDEELSIPFLGNNDDDSWPNFFQEGNSSGFTRIRPCATLVDLLKEWNDPRQDIWFAPVAIPIQVQPSDEIPNNVRDTILSGIRYINQDSLANNNYFIYDPDTWFDIAADGNNVLIDTSSVYVGLPVSVLNADPVAYNLNPNTDREVSSVHTSELNVQFRERSGDYLKSRMFSYSELSFLKAEAAQRGWGSGDAGALYEEGIRASFEAWGIDDQYDDYIAQPEIAYDGTLEQIMWQKWIASFTAASEAYLDWRRTGLPDLAPGPWAVSSVIPVRFVYDDSDKNSNGANWLDAVGRLETTGFTESNPSNDSGDSQWSKPWILQGVTEPW